MSASHRPRPGSAGPPSAPERPRRTAVLAVAAGTVLALDVVSKVLVVAKLMNRPPVKLPTGYLWLTEARNPGAAFSFAEGATVLFTAVAAIVIVVIVRTAAKLRSTAWAISLGLVLGGAAGNLVDRLFRSPAPLRGQVVDWISLRTPEGKMLFPIFNLADSGIVCGGILAVLLAVLGHEMDGTRGEKDTPEPTPPAPGPAGPGPRPATAGPGSGPQPPPGGPGAAGPAPAGPTPYPGPAGPTSQAGPGPISPSRPGPTAGYVPSAGGVAGPAHRPPPAARPPGPDWTDGSGRPGTEPAGGPARATAPRPGGPAPDRRPAGRPGGAAAGTDPATGWRPAGEGPLGG
ncbi:MAG TPA: signal peptidase II [Mycobacteriales bacterium]|nr:signal peptidase II [Mycobacteriales bacterium]